MCIRKCERECEICLSATTHATKILTERIENASVEGGLRAGGNGRSEGLCD